MTPDEPKPIPASEARAKRDAAIRAHIGDDWDDESGEWTLVSGHDYMARLTNGRRTIDVYVDLLGEVSVEEREEPPVISNARNAAWLILGASLFIAFVLARFAGFI